MAERTATEIPPERPTVKALEAFKVLAGFQMKINEASTNGHDRQKQSELRRELDTQLADKFSEMTGSELSHFWMLTGQVDRTNLSEEDLRQDLRLHSFIPEQIEEFLSIRRQIIARGIRNIVR